MSKAMKPDGKAPASTALPAQTSPTTPIDEGPQQFITREEFKDLLVKVLCNLFQQSLQQTGDRTER
ncbi:hypothetical protein EMCG_03912 [[Emmonsia] crescens]|uniref:Uncharacterized protein n=1 Tax=[Emmonsia] crescens TaxID=73230 RepID=A0A0G2J826_9EURO|nr:hypothetical protein EMCG_03912 [Emmonsia crescens UAMH 3008]